MRERFSVRRVASYLVPLLLIAGPALAAGPGVLKFDQLTYGGAEGGTVQVLVERSQGEDGAASVRVLSAGGDATAGADYAAVDVTLNWAAGDSTDRIVNVQLLDDSSPEGAETFNLTLTGATGASIDPTRGQTTITIAGSDQCAVQEGCVGRSERDVVMRVATCTRQAGFMPVLMTSDCCNRRSHIRGQAGRRGVHYCAPRHRLARVAGQTELTADIIRAELSSRIQYTIPITRVSLPGSLPARRGRASPWGCSLAT